jgi:cyanophycin synthetase
MLRDELLAAGVSEERIEVIPDERRALDRSLRWAAAGDLLLVFADAVGRSWEQITHFSPHTGEVAEESAPAPAVPLEPVELPEVAFSDQEDLIRDERGVRLAREPED